MRATTLIRHWAGRVAWVATLCVALPVISTAAPLSTADADSLAAPPSTVGANSPTGTLSLADADSPIAPFLPAVAEASGWIFVSVEAETYIWKSNWGGSDIFVATDCGPYVSGGKAVAGVDYPGDFIELNVSVRQSMLLWNSMRWAGEIGVRSKFVFQYLPAGGHGAPGPLDTLTTGPGKGMT